MLNAERIFFAFSRFACRKKFVVTPEAKEVISTRRKKWPRKKKPKFDHKNRLFITYSLQVFRLSPGTCKSSESNNPNK
jgi:hypothetical protein